MVKPQEYQVHNILNAKELERPDPGCRRSHRLLGHFCYLEQLSGNFWFLGQLD